MPHFYVDTANGAFSHRDTEGLDLPDKSAAREAALAALPDMAREHILDGDNARFVASVRDEHGASVYTATLTLSGVWTVEPTA